MAALFSGANREDDRERDALLEVLDGGVNIDAVHLTNRPLAFWRHDVLDFAVLAFNRLCFGSLEVESVKSDFNKSAPARLARAASSAISFTVVPSKETHTFGSAMQHPSDPLLNGHAGSIIAFSAKPLSPVV